MKRHSSNDVLFAATIALVLLIVWVIADRECNNRARIIGGRNGIITRDMGCVIEMPNGTLRKD